MPGVVRGTASKVDEAYEAIRARITDGSYGPGYRLVFSQLAQQFSVSAVPIREAIRRLEAEGLVEYSRNVGAQVTGINAIEYKHAMETLAIVESAATALAAEVLTEEDLAEAREVNLSMRRSLTDFDPAAFTRLNAEFHRILYHRCPNSSLVEIVDWQWHRMAAIRRSSFGYIPGRAEASVAEHETLLTVLGDRGTGLDEIERMARRHRLGTLRAFLAKQAEEPPTGNRGGRES